MKPQGLPEPGQVAAGDVARRMGRGAGVGVEGVGEDADGDAAAVDAEVGAGFGGGELCVAFGVRPSRRSP